MTTWFESDDPIIVFGPEFVMPDADGDITDLNARKTLAEIHEDFIAAILDTTDGKRPNLEAHASYRAALNERKNLKGFEPAGVFFMRPIADKDFITALLGLGEGPDARADKPNGMSKDTSRGGSPPADQDVRKASAEADAPTPVFTYNYINFL